MNIDAPSAVIVIDTATKNDYILEVLREKVTDFCQNRNVKLIILSDWFDSNGIFENQRGNQNVMPLLKFKNGWTATNKIMSDINDPRYYELINWWQYVNRATLVTDPFTFQSDDNTISFLPFIDNTEQLTSLDSMPVRSDQTLVNSWTMLQLQYLFNVKFKDIENIYFFGGAWNNCLHNRPIGITAFYRAIKNNLFETNKKILTKLDCVYSRAGYHINNFEDYIPSNYTLEEINKMRTVNPGQEWRYHKEHDTYELVSFPLIRSRDQNKLIRKSFLFTEAQARETKSSS